MTGFDPKFLELPKILPVFPLEDALLLPKGHITLRMFEPRYIALIDAVMSFKHRMFVVVQPIHQANRSHSLRNRADADSEILPALYPVACAGRIVSFRETLDCHYKVELKGLYRCHLQTEVSLNTPYRNFKLDFSSYHGDADLVHIHDERREELFHVVKNYFQHRQISVDLELFKNLHDEVLITALAMVCPFSVAEKQGLLEASNLSQRAEFLMNALSMYSQPSPQMVLQ